MAGASLAGVDIASGDAVAASIPSGVTAAALGFVRNGDDNLVSPSWSLYVHASERTFGRDAAEGSDSGGCKRAASEVAWSALASGIGVVIWATSGAASLLRADLRGR